jgi:hypothetical protein
MDKTNASSCSSYVSILDCHRHRVAPSLKTASSQVYIHTINNVREKEHTICTQLYKKSILPTVEYQKLEENVSTVL